MRTIVNKREIYENYCEKKDGISPFFVSAAKYKVSYAYLPNEMEPFSQFMIKKLHFYCFVKSNSVEEFCETLMKFENCI